VLFSVPYNTATIYAYTIATGQVTTAATFPGTTLATVSGGVTDFGGDLYVAHFDANPNSARLVRYTGIPGSPPRVVLGQNQGTPCGG